MRFVVFKAVANEPTKHIGNYKTFTKIESANKCAAKRNEMITTRLLGINYYVFDLVDNTVSLPEYA